MVSVDKELSKRFAKLCEAEPQECFSNSLKALIIASGQMADVKYCEGYASTSAIYGIPIDHAWLEATIDGQSVIIDVTWCNKSETLVYEPLMKIAEKDIFKLYRRRKSIKMPLMWNYRKELGKKNVIVRLTNDGFFDMLRRFSESIDSESQTQLQQ